MNDEMESMCKEVVVSYLKYGSGSIPGGGWEFFSSPPRPEQLWDPVSLLSNGYQGFFPWG